MLTRDEHAELSDLHNHIGNISQIRDQEQRKKSEEHARRILGSLGKKLVYVIVKRNMDHQTKQQFERARLASTLHGKTSTLDQFLENYTCRIDDHYGKPLQHVIVAIEETAGRILQQIKKS